MELSINGHSNEQGALKILVVDDHEINQKELMYFLRKLGFLAEVAYTGFQAVKMAQDKKYDLIFIDIHLPMMDGYTTANTILDDSKSGHSSIVAVTSNPSHIEKDRCLALGMLDYIHKPVKMEDVNRVLEITISRNFR